MAAKAASGGNDTLHVDVIWLALADQPAGRMTQDRDVPVLHGADDAIGLGIARQIEVRVH